MGIYWEISNNMVAASENGWYMPLAPHLPPFPQTCWRPRSWEEWEFGASNAGADPAWQIPSGGVYVCVCVHFNALAGSFYMGLYIYIDYIYIYKLYIYIDNLSIYIDNLYIYIYIDNHIHMQNITHISNLCLVAIACPASAPNVWNPNRWAPVARSADNKRSRRWPVTPSGVSGAPRTGVPGKPWKNHWKTTRMMSLGQLFLANGSPPPETYRFWFLIIVEWFLKFCLFLPSKTTSIISFIWRLWMLECDELWCFMCRYNDIFWWYLQRFRLPCWASNKDFQFKHWQNAHGAVAKCQV